MPLIKTFERYPMTPKYDVAISFLSVDSTIAGSFNQRLTETLQVFFFPRNQEELAGTDGLESMRKPFFDDSRLAVVLYREGWGRTPWTGVEETAIKDSCLEHGWRRLFFIVLDSPSTLPIWVPHTHVYLNYKEYGLEQAVGAIKARVQEQGGQNLPMTAIRRADLLKAEELFAHDKAKLDSEEGLRKIVDSVHQLFVEIERHCADINAKGSVQITCESQFRERSATQICIMTNEAVSVTVTWNQPYTNILEGTSLSVREYKGRRLILPSEVGRKMYVSQPRTLGEARYTPTLSFSRDCGWKRYGEADFVSSATLAEQCVMMFLDLAGRAVRRELDQHNQR